MMDTDLIQPTQSSPREGPSRPRCGRRERSPWMHGKQSADQKRIEELARVNRFNDFTPDEMHHVVEAATYLTVPAGWALMVEQQPADKAYLILSGEVSVRRHGEE